MLGRNSQALTIIFAEQLVVLSFESTCHKENSDSTWMDQTSNHKCEDVETSQILGVLEGNGGKFQQDSGRYPGGHVVITWAVLLQTRSQEEAEHNTRGTKQQEGTEM